MERPNTNLVPTPIFGLRYLEDEDADINGIAGCLTTEPGDGGGGGGGGGTYPPKPTYYTTN